MWKESLKPLTLNSIFTMPYQYLQPQTVSWSLMGILVYILNPTVWLIPWQLTLSIVGILVYVDRSVGLDFTVHRVRRGRLSK
jgi:hypothetical protein